MRETHQVVWERVRVHIHISSSIKPSDPGRLYTFIPTGGSGKRETGISMRFQWRNPHVRQNPRFARVKSSVFGRENGFCRVQYIRLAITQFFQRTRNISGDDIGRGRSRQDGHRVEHQAASPPCNFSFRQRRRKPEDEIYPKPDGHYGEL
jgi:hypothetical protein